MQFLKNQDGSGFTDDWHSVSFYRQIDDNTIECRDSAYAKLKKCYWKMPAKRNEDKTFLICEVERIRRL